MTYQIKEVLVNQFGSRLCKLILDFGIICINIRFSDDFQGEEAKIIIISLVRSNNTRNVGFLRSMNRINVLLRSAFT
jgi:hypothetical protein